MAEPKAFPTITTQTSTFVGKTPGDRQGVTLLVSGDFNGATATAGYQAADNSIVNFAGTDAVLTADGEISIVTGNSVKVHLTTTVANPTGIDVLTTYW